MIGTLHEAGPRPPKRGGKHNHRQQKEDSRDLKPQDAPHPAKWAKKAANATRNAPCHLSCSLTGGPVLSGSGGSSLWVDRRMCGSFSAGGHALTGNAPGDPQPDPQSASNGVRFHSVYDGSSDPR